MEYEIYSDGELYHWGVRGMRWGVRRYQNKDGSLTKAGKKRLKAETDKLKQEEQVLKNRKATKAKFDRLEARKKALEDDKKEFESGSSRAGSKGKNNSSSDTTNSSKKSVKDMSDDELSKAVNRARLEEQYKQLNPEPPVKQSLMKKMINEVVVPAATNSGKKLLENALNKVGENLLKDKPDPNSYEAIKKAYDKLDLETKLENLKKYPESGINWDNMLKKQQYERDKKKKDDG